VLGVERDRVKIGISAPGEVTVLRQELWSEENADKPFEKKSGGSSSSSGPAAASA
jgi:carbon storage regulator CsrA